MGRLTNNFVFAKREITTTEGILVRMYEVGIVEGKTGDYLMVSFIMSGVPIRLHKQDVETFDVKKVGDLYPKKVCNVCQRLLDTTQFQKNQNGKGDRPVRRPSCNECRQVMVGRGLSPKEKKEWIKAKPAYVRFTCPICGKTTIPGLTSKVVLDHDHSNGQVRGWICDSCNTGIGRFKDDISLLEKAITFLKKK